MRVKYCVVKYTLAGLDSQA